MGHKHIKRINQLNVTCWAQWYISLIPAQEVEAQERNSRSYGLYKETRSLSYSTRKVNTRYLIIIEIQNKPT